MPSRFLNNITVNDEYTLPSADGTADQIITTDGAGQLSFVDQSTLNSGSAERTEILVKNVHGSALSKGDPVYIVGSVGASDRLEVALADASDTAKMPCVGLLTQDLANNGEGTATVTGKLRNLITSPIDGSTPTENDTIYVKSGGGLTLTKPTGSTNLIQNVGQVGRVSISSDGNIVVSAILRSNDVPNLPTGKIWVGDSNTTVSDVVYLDETNERMGINTTSPTASIHVVDNTTDDSVLITSTNTSSSAAPVITLKRDSSSPADGDYLGQLKFKGENSASQEIVYAKITGKISDVTDTTEDGLIETAVKSGGSNLIVSRQTGTDLKLINGIGLQVDGNVGIGTTSPGAKLDVVSGDIRLGTNATYFRVRDTASAQPRVLGMNTSNTFYIGPIDSYAGGAIAYGVSGNVSYHGFYGGGSEKVRITSSGSVGIGTTSPSYTLDVNGVIRGEQILYLKDTGGTNRLTIQAESSYVTQSVGALAQNFVANYYRFYDDAFSEMMRIADNGNVGIGTTAPAQKLHVIGNSEITGDIFLGRYIFHNDDTNTWIGFPSNDTFTIRTNGSDRVRVTSGGNFGIGTASPTSIFHVKQTLASPSVPMVYFEADRGPSAYGAVNVRVDNLDYGTGMRFYRSGTYDSTAIGFINGSSTVGSITISTSSTSYNTTSDYRLKENVTSITDGIARVKQLKPKRFNFIGDTSVVDGFIAHEAQGVVPEAVTGEKDEVLPNGDPLYQGIDQAKVVPLLTAALQEAITKIEQLETRIQTLELD